MGIIVKRISIVASAPSFDLGWGGPIPPSAASQILKNIWQIKNNML